MVSPHHRPRNVLTIWNRVSSFLAILGTRKRRILWIVAIQTEIGPIVGDRSLLMTGKIGFGAAFAAAAALLYVPFSERTLVRLAYPVI